MARIKEILKTILTRLPGRYILLESAPDFSDNTKAVFDEMIRRGLNKKYKFVWLCHDEMRRYPKIKNVTYLQLASTRLNQWRCSYYHIRIKLALSCNRMIAYNGLNASLHQGTASADCKKNGSIYFHLDHGSPFKDARLNQRLPFYYDYMLCTSKQMMPYRMETFNITDERKMVCLGYPRNDIFSTIPKDFYVVFKKSYSKLVVWMPTFRQHKGGRNSVSTITLPIIHDAQLGIQLNEWACKHDILIALKAHYAQDTSYIKDLGLSNIVFISDNFLYENGVTSYDLLNASDALLSDYSSVYYDYTLHDKPIGLIWEDIEIYQANRGLVPNYEFWSQGGVKIYNYDELIAFLNDVSEGKDAMQDARRRIRESANVSSDGNNTKRVTDFIIEKAKL